MVRTKPPTWNLEHFVVFETLNSKFYGKQGKKGGTNG